MSDLRAAAEAVRQRDVLWAKALIASLDARDIERVTRAFNASRPDPDPALSREPSDEEVARELEAAWRKVGFTNFAPEQAMEIVLQVRAAEARAERSKT